MWARMRETVNSQTAVDSSHGKPSSAPQSERRPGVLGREHGPYVGPYMERPCRSLCGPLDEALSLTILHTEGGPYVGPCMKHLSSPHTGARIPSTAAGPYVGSYARHIPRSLCGPLREAPTPALTSPI